MSDARFTKLPRALEDQTRIVTLAGDVPALLAHPDWQTPAPAVLWMHGRTVSKELDPGRYLRWLRAGIATVAVDLPGHGARLDRAHHGPDKTLDTVEQMVGEIDPVLGALDAYDGVFDPARLAIGGMSAGGMATLRRLCDHHPFVAAAVEGTTGDLGELYFPTDPGTDRGWPVAHDRAAVAALDPAAHLDGFRPIPVLALHNEGDAIVPIATQRRFLDALREHYQRSGADPGLIELRTFSDTGAPSEHAGFGRAANEAKNTQTAFLSRVFGR